jgi:hypothetical protein
MRPGLSKGTEAALSICEGHGRREEEMNKKIRRSGRRSFLIFLIFP